MFEGTSSVFRYKKLIVWFHCETELAVKHCFVWCVCQAHPPTNLIRHKWQFTVARHATAVRCWVGAYSSPCSALASCGGEWTRVRLVKFMHACSTLRNKGAPLYAELWLVVLVRDAGWQRRPPGGQKRKCVVVGGGHELGHWMRTEGQTRSLWQHQPLYRLDPQRSTEGKVSNKSWNLLVFYKSAQYTSPLVV